MAQQGLTLFRGPTAIRRTVLRLASRIDEDAKGEPLLMVGVLMGAFPFLADLLRAMRSQVEVDFLRVRSYGRGTTPGGIELLSDMVLPVSGRKVVLVDDIVDTGLTTRFLLRHLHGRRPKSLKVCTLLDKPSRRAVEVPIHYRGFSVPDRFVVGYGLDRGESYRQLPGLYFLEGAAGESVS